MLRLAVTLDAGAAADAVDALVPLLPRGVHERELGDGRVEISFFEHADALPSRAELHAAAGAHGWTEEEVPDDPLERRRRFGRAWVVGDRLRVRPTTRPARAAYPSS